MIFRATVKSLQILFVPRMVIDSRQKRFVYEYAAQTMFCQS